ncbi:ATP-binding protein [Planosporangium sp. 12N6]|uniref:PAS domain-containing sensor histidine kinase n=1 Tax=Planosporangium spinosum TaxID=3402278 RepID=UPI003CEF1102
MAAELTPPAARALAARAERASSLVEVQRLLGELRTLPGVRDAALESSASPSPGGIPVGPARWRLALQVYAVDELSYRQALPAVEEIAAAVERCLTRPCPAMPADRAMPVDPLGRSLLAADRAAVVLVDPPAGWVALSDEFTVLLGYDRQAPPPVSPLDLVHPDDHAVAVASLVDACAGRGPDGPFDLRVRASNGQWRTLEVTVRGLLDDPQVGAVAYLGVDVTAQRATERVLREELSRLRGNRPAATPTSGGVVGSSFVPTVAHELRGPLSAVVAFAHLLGDPGSGGLTDEQRTYLDVIDRNANRLLRLIEELLTLSRLEAGTLPLKHTAVRVPALLDEVVAERRLAAEAAGIELALHAVDGPELVCDEARLQQVLGNLLANSLAFTPSGGRISVRARPVRTGWELVVSDNGIGIPAAEQPRLFSPFFRASNVGAAAWAGTSGAGLGLVISRAIVELHGGAINVASTEGVGTTVTVSLPARPRGNDGGLEGEPTTDR